uniref:Cytochrome P450 n=1 Tax=Nothapodytes nimmoniana TaxID=159386 RepID=A0A7L7RBB0_NOTNI|nr:cytochrome P450 [Nothapodytes nimmoniana]
MELLSLQIPFFFFILLYISLYLFRPKSGAGSTAAGFKFYPLVGILPDFLRHRHRFLEWTTGVLSNCPTQTAVLHRPGKIHGIITANPSNVEHMLKTKFENYPKGTRFISFLQDFLGTGIFNSDGELWKIQRKTASFEFNTKSLRNFVMECVTVEIQTRLIPILANTAKTNKIIDLQDILERFAFDNICKVAFNVDPGCLAGDGNINAHEFMKAFEEAATLSSGRFMYALPSLYKIKRFFKIGSEYQLQKSIGIVHEFADNIIKSRMEDKTAKKEEDLLSRFIGDHQNSAEFLRDIVISFILAGRDTTSSALSWFFWFLSSRPCEVKRILEEIQKIRAKNGSQKGEIHTFDQLREMNYLHAAISEAMRLYPPVPLDTRKCRADDTLPDGTFVGKDWFITYHSYAMGRMESLWGEDCGEYRPERWMENGVFKQESPFRFPVFHAGPRICLGKDMAYIQMKSIAAAVMESFDIQVVEKEKCPEHLLSLTLRMKGGLPVTVRERSVDENNSQVRGCMD